MIYDVFMVLNEAELLEIRLNELQNHVDEFIILESEVTFTGLKKEELFLEKFWDRFKHFNINYKVLKENDIPEFPKNNQGDWDREIWIRDYLRTEFSPKIKDDDVVLFTDLDEIPHTSVLDLFKSEMGIANIDMRYFIYWLNGFRFDYWIIPKIMNGFYFRSFKTDQLRSFHQDFRKEFPMLTFGRSGCHFSSCAPLDRLQEKFRAFSHARQKNVEWTRNEFKNGRRPDQVGIVAPNPDVHPKYLMENLDHYLKIGLLHPWDSGTVDDIDDTIDLGSSFKLML